jgi:hypothetical protein
MYKMRKTSGYTTGKTTSITAATETIETKTETGVCTAKDQPGNKIAKRL